MYLFMPTLQPSPPTPGLRTTWIWYPYALLMLLFRWDANCCVWPHFVPNCDLFRIPHQQDISDAMQPSSSLLTHPQINPASINHSVCIFTMVNTAQKHHSCHANDAAIITSMNASLDEIDEYESLYECFHCEEIWHSFARRICFGWCRATHKRIITYVMSVFWARRRIQPHPSKRIDVASK